MSKVVVLNSSVFPADDPQRLRGRLMTFQSSLFGCLRDTGWGKVDWSELDKLEPTFSVFDVKDSRLKRLRDWIEKEAPKHGLLTAIDAPSA